MDVVLAILIGIFMSIFDISESKALPLATAVAIVIFFFICRNGGGD